MTIVTGWADGGLRKFELNTYLQSSSVLATIPQQQQLETQQLSPSPSFDAQRSPSPTCDHYEWNLTSDQVQKDFIRNLVVIEGRLICCTNLGNLNLIETDRLGVGYPSSASPGTTENSQKLLFKSILLSNYTVMSKIKVDQNKWILAIGTLKGSSVNSG